MVRRLDMDKTQGIEQLFASGMTKRQIARTLGASGAIHLSIVAISESW